MADPYRTALVEESDPFVEPDPFPGSHPHRFTAYDLLKYLRIPPRNWADWEYNANMGTAITRCGYALDDDAERLLRSACKPEWLER